MKTTSYSTFLAGVLMVGVAIMAYAAEPLRPNIILIMCDDMGWSDIGCYGGEVRTPTLDTLAAEGVRFTQFYNNAKCTTRASVVTGLYPRHGGRGSNLLDEHMVTFSEVLRGAGYQTALVGEWHLGSKHSHRPCDRGFDEYYGLMDECCNYFNPAQRDPTFKGGRIRVFGHNDQIITQFPEDFYTTDAFTDHAIKTVRRFAQSDKPFFLHLTYTAPDYPLQAKSEDIAAYRGRFRMGWDQMREQRYRRQIRMGLIDPTTYFLSQGDPKRYDWKTANQAWEDVRMAVYAAMITSMDRNIGRLMATLKTLGIDEDTVVMFLSDKAGCSEEPGGPKLQRNPVDAPGSVSTYMSVGPAWGWAQNAPFKRYKANTHEGGVRTPFIARWPGKIKADRIEHQPGHVIDFMPTFVELTGARYPEVYHGKKIIPLEGKSLLPVLLGQRRKPHENLMWHWAGNRAIRAGDWKAVWEQRERKWKLYHLATDQTKTKDVAATHLELVDTLAARWRDWADRTGVRYSNN